MGSLSVLSPLLLLFFLGTSGLFLFRNNIIVVLMGIELMLLAVNLILVLLSVQLDDLLGQLFALFILTVAAAESAIGLAILVVYYRLRGVIAIDYISALKGLAPPLSHRCHGTTYRSPPSSRIRSSPGSGRAAGGHGHHPVDHLPGFVCTAAGPRNLCDHRL